MYMFIDIIWLIALMFVLLILMMAVYLLGRYVHKTSTRKEMQDACKHKDINGNTYIEYNTALGTYWCSKCGVPFEFVRKKNVI